MQEAVQGFSVMNLFVVPVAPGRSRAYFKVFTNVESKFAKVPPLPPPFHPIVTPHP